MSLKDLMAELQSEAASQAPVYAQQAKEKAEKEAAAKASRLEGFKNWAENEVAAGVQKNLKDQFAIFSSTGVLQVKVVLKGRDHYSGSGPREPDPFEDLETRSILKDVLAEYLTREATSFTPVEVQVNDRSSEWDPDWGGYSWREMHATSKVTL